jgi:hypothetical protein
MSLIPAETSSRPDVRKFPDKQSTKIEIHREREKKYSHSNKSIEPNKVQVDKGKIFVAEYEAGS